MLVIDVDALSKLAHWKILPLLPALTGYPWEEMATVSSLIHRAVRSSRSPDGKIFFSQEAAIASVEAISQMSNLPSPSLDVVDYLSTSNQIDSGEAVLLATIVENANDRILTGDKRALRALSQLEYAQQFSGKVFLVEHILRECLKKRGREWVLQNVCPFKRIDKSISIILGSQCDASDDDMIEGLQSYITEIENLHDPSLLAKCIKKPQPSGSN